MSHSKRDLPPGASSAESGLKRQVPPSVNDIAARIKSQAALQNPSQAVLVRAARKLQKRWNAQSLLRDFNDLPGPRRPVINGSGVLLHTNLGRAPLGKAVLERLNHVLTGYVNLEMNLNSGERGGRTAYLDELFRSMVPGYEPVWVNNNAAGVLLCLNTLRKMTDITRLIISRGELVEIGGGFRVPDIMAEGGFELVEVGTTNKTRLKDYEQALKKGPGVVCRVHPSNFVMRGFTESVEPKDLIPLCRKYKSPLLYDAGTYTGDELRKLPKGFDMVTISTDKTLGGIQGGLVMAKPKLQKELLKNPLYRALRLDKLSLTALEVTFEAHAERTDRKILPFSEMLATGQNVLRERARRIAEALPLQNFILDVIDCDASVGGGSLPGETFPSAGVRIVPREKASGAAERVIRALRRAQPAVLGSIIDAKTVINLRTVMSSELELLQGALKSLDANWKA